MLTVALLGIDLWTHTVVATGLQNKPIGLLEAMKTFTEIQVNVTGVVVEILAENGQFIEHGTVLFRVDPAA